MGVGSWEIRVPLEVLDIVVLAVVGLGAGVIGGMLGLGGSLIMIPAMAVLFAARDFASQHLYQASAMAVNVAVAVPAMVTHAKKGAFRRDLFVRMLPWMTGGILVGVLVSDQFPGWVLQYAFALFLIYTGVSTVLKLARTRGASADSDGGAEPERLTALRCAVVGGMVGVVAGLLGIGGGALFVPLCLVVCRVPLRHAIAVSAALMCLTAAAGSALKLWGLGSHGDSVGLALTISGVLAPTSVVGSFLGARLTHALPVRRLKLVFGVTLIVVAAKLFHTAEGSRSAALPTGDTPAAQTAQAPATG